VGCSEHEQRLQVEAGEPRAAAQELQLHQHWVGQGYFRRPRAAFSERSEMSSVTLTVSA
jgi:hypothetical protein